MLNVSASEGSQRAALQPHPPGDPRVSHFDRVIAITDIGIDDTRRRVRRMLPEWMELENRPDVPDEDLSGYEGVPATTVRGALGDMWDRMPPDRWEAVVDEALRRDLTGARRSGLDKNLSLPRRM
jgi:hypothetical protein